MEDQLTVYDAPTCLKIAEPTGRLKLVYPTKIDLLQPWKCSEGRRQIFEGGTAKIDSRDHVVNCLRSPFATAPRISH